MQVFLIRPRLKWKHEVLFLATSVHGGSVGFLSVEYL